MNSSDGNSTAPPLHKRKSKRFDRVGSGQRLGGAIDPESDADLMTRSPADEEVEPAGVEEGAGSEPAADDAAPEPALPDAGSPAFVPDDQEMTKADAAPALGAVVTEGAVRTKTLDERQACGRCGHELSMVNIEVDGNVLIMESCDNCDARRWHMAGEQIDLQQVLDHVGEHAGRRR